MATNTMATNATPPSVGFVDRGSNYAAKQARIEKDEKELEKLMEGREVQEDEVEEVAEETEESTEVEAVEEEDDSELSREEKSFKKRYGDLRRHMAEKEKEWKDKLESATSQPESIRAPKSDEDIEAWARKYPDVAAIVETIADKKASERFASAEGRFKELDEAKYEATRTKAETAIRKAHADFDELREADAFHDWVDVQPKWVRDALYENSDDADSVVRVLDLYKVDNGLTPSDKKARAKDAAKTVTKTRRASIDANDSGSMIKESDVAKMSDKQFEDRYDAIQEAMASGKFVYDVSGKAR